MIQDSAETGLVLSYSGSKLSPVIIHPCFKGRAIKAGEA